MQQAGVMDRLEALGQLSEDRAEVGPGGELRQWTTLEVLGDQVGALGGAAGVEDAQHVRMLQAGKDLRLSLGAGEELRIAGIEGELDDHLAIQLAVVGEQDDTHAAAAELSKRLVAALQLVG
jgi:hypothetical protein